MLNWEMGPMVDKGFTGGIICSAVANCCPHSNKACQSTLLLDWHTTNNANIVYISSLHDLFYAS